MVSAIQTRPSSHSQIQATSTTHEHLLSVLAAESQRFEGTVKVLDAGCGRGVLMEYLEAMLPHVRPSLNWEIWGFDVSDHGSVPHEGSPDHIHRISITDPWPYRDQSFDVVISNQVMEHVADPHLFLSQLHRVLKPGGFSAHLFPLKHYIWEGHLHLPFVHRIRNADLRRSYISLLSRLGLGRYPDHHKAFGIDRETFAQQHADFIAFFTRYMTYSEALELATSHGFRSSFRYTRDLYTRKVQKLLCGGPPHAYSSKRSAFADWISTMVLRYVSGVTWFLEKDNTYSHGTEERVRERLDIRNTARP